MRAFLISLIVLTAVLTALPSRGQAQQLFGIAAVVNDNVISNFDLEERIDLVVVTANLPRTQDTRRRLRQQILSTLVDEALQRQAALEIGVVVTDEEIDEALGRLADRNNLTAAGLTGRLEAAGVNISTLRDQLLTQLAWERFVSARLLRSIEVSDEEIDSEVQEREAAKGQRQYLVSEIVLGIENPGERENVQAAAQRLAEQIRRGGDFAALARQFSEGPTADDGGIVGWVTAKQVGEEVGAALAAQQGNGLIGPVEQPFGFTLLTVRDTRVVGEEDQNSIELELAQLLLPLGRNAPADAVATAESTARDARERIRSCAGLPAVAESVPGASSAQLGSLKLGDLPENFRDAIVDLNVGDVSQPVRTAAGFHLLVVCQRSAPANAGINRDAVRNELIFRKLNQRSQAKLRDLRRSAIVDYR